MKPSPALFAVPLFCIFSSLSPQAVSPQDFSSIGADLSALESLIHDTLKNSAEQQRHPVWSFAKVNRFGGLPRNSENQKRETFLVPKPTGGNRTYRRDTKKARGSGRPLR
jgi:hypothetical protein